MLAKAPLDQGNSRARTFRGLQHERRAAHMQEAIQPTILSEAANPLAAAAYRAEVVGGRAVPSRGRGSRRSARTGNRAPARARRRDRRDRRRARRSRARSGRCATRLMLGLERVLADPEPHTAAGTAASQPSDRRARRDAHRADRRGAAPGGERQRARRRRGGRRRGGRGRRRSPMPRTTTTKKMRAADARAGSGRDPPLPLPPSDRVRQDDRRRRLRRRRAHARRAHPHAPPPARHAVHDRPDDRGVQRPVQRRDRDGQGAATHEPAHDSDVRVVRASRRLDQPRRVPARDLRRGAHGARREDVRRDPLVPGADLHRHDGDRAADREAGRRTSSPRRSTTCRCRTPRGAA